MTRRAVAALALGLGLAALSASSAGAFVCTSSATVRAFGGGNYTTIQAAVNGVPNPLSANYCINVDSSTYPEQVTIRGLAFTGGNVQLVIQSDPTLISTQATISPPSASTAAFQVINASVTIANLIVNPTNAITYGVFASSDYVTVSSMSLQDPLGRISNTGIWLSSFSTISNSSITVAGRSDGVDLNGNWDTVSQSSVQVNSTSGPGFGINGSASSSSTVSGSYILTTGASANGINFGLGAGDTISSSTISIACPPDTVNPGFGTTITGSFISNSVGRALTLGSAVSGVTIRQSTITDSSAMNEAVHIDGSNDTLLQDYIFGASSAVVLSPTASLDAISGSTITTNSTAAALFINGASTNTITQSLISSPGGSGVNISNALGNTISQSTITSNSAGYKALVISGSTSNVITQSLVSNAAGPAASLAGDSRDLITKSTITTAGALSGLALALGGFADTIDQSYVEGSPAVNVSGATNTVIDGSVLAAHTSGGQALYAFANVGLSVATSTLLGNGLNYTLVLAPGNAGSLALSTNTIIGGTDGLGIEPQAAGAILAVSSLTFSGLAPGSTAIIFTNSGGNDTPVGTVGPFAATLSSVSFDASVAVNVDARVLVGSTITMVSPSGPRAGSRFDTDPFGEIVWPPITTPACGAGYATVCASGCDAGTIGQAVAMIPTTPLAGNFCIDTQDNRTYAEQITLQGYNPNNFQIIIGTTTSGRPRPTISPPAASTAAFVVANASVTIANVNVVPTAALTYGVLASSPNITFSSVNIQDPAGYIGAAGILISSYCAVTMSSITVQIADGLRIQGTGSTVSFSTAIAANVSGNGLTALHLLYASSTTITSFYANGGGNTAGYLVAASNNVIGQSTFTVNSNNPAFWIAGFNGQGNTLTRSVVSNSGNGDGIFLGGSYDTFSLDSVTSNGAGGIAAHLSVSSYTLLSSDFIQSPAGSAIVLDPGVNLATISLSTATNNASGNATIQIPAGSQNMITNSYVYGGASTAVYITNGASNNTISQSTITSNSSSAPALFIQNSSTNNVTSSYVTNNSGQAVLLQGASSNTLSGLTVSANGNAPGLLITANSSTNTVTTSFISNSFTGNSAAQIDGGSVFNTISFSTITGRQGSNCFTGAVLIQGSGTNNNTLTTDSISDTVSGGAVHFYNGPANNLVFGSTITSIGGSSCGSGTNTGVYFGYGSPITSNTISNCFISAGPGNGALGFDSNANNNTVTQSTLTATGAGSQAFGMGINNATGNTVTQSYLFSNGNSAAGSCACANATISNSTIAYSGSSAAVLSACSGASLINDMILSYGAGQGVVLTSCGGSFANNTTIANSTITAGGTGLNISQVTGGNITGSYTQGNPAVVLQGSTATVISNSVLVATATAGSALYVNSGSKGISVTTSTLVGGLLGQGIFLDVGNSGTLAFTSNTVRGAVQGFKIASQVPSAALSISSLTFQNLTAGATAVNFTGGTFVSTFSAVSFDNSVAVNVNASLLTGSTITMTNVAGPKAGPIFANDPAGQVVWSGLPVSQLNVPLVNYAISLANVAGTASAFNGNTISAVYGGVKRLSDGFYWNGSAFTSAFSASTAAFVGGSSGTWNNGSGPPQSALAVGTQYAVFTYAVDSLGVQGYTTQQVFTAVVNSGVVVSGSANTGAFVYNGVLGNAGKRPMVRDSSGNLYLAYLKLYNGKRRVFLARSTDNGATWSDTTAAPIETAGDVPTANSYDQSDPALAIDSKDILHLVWGGQNNVLDTTGSVEPKLVYSSAAVPGTSWSAYVKIPANSYDGYEGPFLIAVDAYDGLHVVWNGQDCGTAGCDRIRYSSRTATSASWTPFIEVNNDGFEAALPAMVVDANNVVHIVTSKGTISGNGNIPKISYSSRSAAGVWSPWTDIVNDPGGHVQRDASLAIDAGGNLIAVWRGADGTYANDQIKYSVLPPGGSWSAPGYVSTIAAAPQYAPAVATDASGKAYAVWVGSHTGNSVLNIKESVYNGASWGPFFNVSTGTTIQQTPWLRWSGWRDNGGGLGLSWIDYDGVSSTAALRSLQDSTVVMSQGFPSSVFVSATDVSPSTVPVNGVNVPLLRLGVWSSGAATLSSLNVGLNGNAPSSNVSASLWSDSDNDGIFQPTDTLLATTPFGAGTPPLALLATSALTLGGTTQYFFVTVSYSSMSVGRQLGVSLGGPGSIGVAGAPLSPSIAFPLQSGQPMVQQLVFANPAAQGAATPVPNPSPSGGLDTGFPVQVGQAMIISATGTWSSGALAGVVTATGSAATGGLGSGLNLGSLVGRIGGGNWFQLGSSVAVVAAQAGDLFLAMNDTYYLDNSGALTVQAQVLASTTPKVWTGASGLNSNASTNANWLGGLPPLPGDTVIFDGSHNSPCTWDIYGANLGLLQLTTSYSQTVTIAPAAYQLVVASDVFVGSGTLVLGGAVTLTVQGKLKINGGVFDMGPGGGALQAGGPGISVGGGGQFKSVGTSSVTIAAINPNFLFPFAATNGTLNLNNAQQTQIRDVASVSIGTQTAATINNAGFFNTNFNSYPSISFVGCAGAGPCQFGFNNLFFDVNVSSNIDASSLVAGSTVNVTKAYGPRFGSPFDKDPNRVVFWSPDGGASGAISGNLTNAGTGSGMYTVVAYTAPPGGTGPMTFVFGSQGTFLKAVNGGPGGVEGGNLGGSFSFGTPPPYSLGLAAPNTYYVYAWRDPSGNPTGVSPRGAYGNGPSQGMVANPVFVPAGVTVSGINLTINDWAVVTGTITQNSSQFAPISANVWVGAPNVTGSTLAASFDLAALGQGGATTYALPAPPTTVQSFAFIELSTANFTAYQPFEASGSSGPIALSTGATPNGLLNISGGSSPPGGTLTVATANPFTAHPGYVGYDAVMAVSVLPQAMLRLDLAASASSVTLTSLRVDLGVTAPANGLLLTLWRDNGDGVFDNPALGGPGPFDAQLNSPAAFVPPGTSSAVIVLSSPETILSGTTNTYFVAVDLKGQSPPPFQMSIASSSYFTLAQGAMAGQPAVYPIQSSTASVKFAVLAGTAAVNPSSGGTDTGLFVAAGQSVIVNGVAGSWHVSAASATGPSGLAGTSGQNTVVPAANLGQFIGRVGDSLGNGATWYAVTPGIPFLSPASGDLFLAQNNYPSSYFGAFGAAYSTFSVTGSTVAAIAGTITYLGNQTGSLLVHADEILPCAGCALPPTVALSTITLTLTGGTTLYPYVLGGLPAQFPYRIGAVVQSNPSQTGRSAVQSNLVAGSTSTGVNFTMSLGSGSIAGAISYAGVQNVGQFELAVFDDNTNQLVALISTPAPAAYAFTGLPTPATYYVFGFRDVNGDQQPDGAEPAGLGGDASLTSLFLGPPNLIFLDTAAAIAGENFPLFDRGDISGGITFPTGSPSADLVVEVWHGVPGTPGAVFEDQQIYVIPSASPGDTFVYDVGLLRPATDYAVLAFVSTDFSDVFKPGNSFALDQGPLNVPSAAFVNDYLILSGSVPPPPPTGFAGQALSTQTVLWTWNSAPGAAAYNLQTSTGGLWVSLSSMTLLFVDTVAVNDSYSHLTQIVSSNTFGASGAVAVPAVASLAAVAGQPGASAVFQSSANIVWSSNGNSAPTAYQLYRATASGGPFALDLTTATTSVMDTGLLPATAYWWGVRSINLNGATTVMGATGTATTLSAAGPAVAGTISYPGRQVGMLEIQIATSATFSPLRDLARLPDVSSQPYYLAEAANTTYYLRAFVDVVGDGNIRQGEDATVYVSTYVAAGPVNNVALALSSSSLVPASPVGLGFNTPRGSVVLNWTAPGLDSNGSPLIDLAGYRVYRSTLTSGPFVLISIGSVYGTTGTVAGAGFADSSPVPNVQNYYRVSAVNLAGLEGLPSGAVGVTPLLGGTIAGVLQYLGGTTQGAFHIRLSSTPDISSFIAETTLSTFSFTGLPDGVYFVEAFRDLNGSGKPADGDPDGDLGGLAAPYPINVFGGSSVTGSTLTVCDHTSVAFGLGAPSTYSFTTTTSGCPALDQGPGFFTSLLSFRVGGGAANSVGVGAQVNISLQSVYPNRLLLLGPGGGVVASNTNGGGAGISYQVNQPGLYFIEPTSFNPYDVGPATITLSVNGGFSGTISGNASYSGAQPGKLVVQLFTPTSGGFPILQSTFSAPGPYSVGGLPDGVYYARAYRDANGNGAQDPGEPSGAFGVSAASPTAVQIQGGVTFINGASGGQASITLTDPAAGTVAGQILRQGTQSGTIYVQVQAPSASCTNCGLQTVAFATIAAAGPYAVPFVPPATSYTILAFVDVAGAGQLEPLEAQASTSPITVQANQTTSINLLLADPGSGVSGNSTISGAVSYGGSSTGPLLIAFATDPNFNSIPYLLSQASTGSFIKTGLVGGTSYYAAAFLDTNNNGEPDMKLGEPIGFYGSNPFNDFNSKQPIFVPANGAVAANITLADAPTGSISGQVTYSGLAPVNENIIVQASLQGGGSSGPFYFGKAVIARSAGVATYNYNLPFLAAATNYIMQAWVDAAGNGQQGPGEPFGLFGCGAGGCSGAPVAVSSGPNTFPTYGANVTIVDPNSQGVNFSGTQLQLDVTYLGSLSGPVYFRVFSTSTYSGSPVQTVAVPLPPGPGEAHAVVSGLPFGTYYVDAFRDPSGTGVLNRAFDAYATLNSVTLSQVQSYAGVFGGTLSDPGQGGSVNAYTGGFSAPGGARFDGGAVDIAVGVALDTITAGGPYAYVLGLTNQNQGIVTSMVKYSSAGVFLASATVDRVQDIQGPYALDSAGNVYLPQQTQIANGGNGEVLKLDRNLNTVVAVQISSSARVSDVVLSNGALYVASEGDCGDMVVRRHDPGTFVATATGTFAGFDTLGGPPNCGASGEAVAVDLAGDVYVVATSANTSLNGTSQPLWALLKFAPGLGAASAAQDITGLIPGTPNINLGVDSSGNVFLAVLPTGDSNAHTYKFNSSLRQVGAASYGPVLNHFNGGLLNLVVSTDNYVYEAWESPADAGDFLALRYDDNLNLLAQRTFDGRDGAHEDFAFGIAVQDSSDVYLAGGVTNANNNLDWATVRLNMNASGAASAAGAAIAITSANATDAIYGTLSYGGALVTSGTVRALLLPLGSNTPIRFSSAPFAAATPYLFNNVPAGIYQIQAFIDGNGNFIPDAGEPVGVSISTGFSFSATSSTIVNLSLCDRRPIAFNQPLTDTVTSGDCTAPDLNGTHQRLYTFAGSRGQAVTIEDDAVNFYDAPVRLYDPNSALLAANDGGAGSGNSLIANFLLPLDGLYTIAAGPYSPGISSATIKLTLGGSAGSLGSISGSVNYTGAEGGKVVMGLFSTSTFLSGAGASPVSVVALPGPGPFAIGNLATGATYYLGGFIDVDGNGKPDPGEDGGFFGSSVTGPAPIFLRSGQSVSGVNFTITPFSTATLADVSGVVSYAGAQTGQLHVELWANSSFTGQPVASRVVPTGPGAYDVLVPGGLPYYVRAWLDASGAFVFAPTDASGLYAQHNQGAEAVFAPSSGSLVGVSFAIADPGQQAGGIAGEGSASIAPSSAAAGAQVFSATITYTAGAHGVNPGGTIGFSVPPGFPSPLLPFITLKTTATATFAVSTTPVSALATVQTGSVLLGQQVSLVYTEGPVPCLVLTQTFVVSESSGAGVTPQPLVAGSPGLAVVQGPPAVLLPSNPYLSLTQGLPSDAQFLVARDLCGNQAPAVSLTTATLTAQRFDVNTSTFVADATVGLSTAVAVSTAGVVNFYFAIGQSSAVFYAVASSTGFKNVKATYNFGAPTTFYYGLTVLPSNALTGVSVSTVSFGLGQTSAQITPNGGGASVAYVNFTLGDPTQGWDILISSIPFKPGVVPTPVWQAWGSGQPNLGQVAWDGRYSPWLNGGVRVPSGFYFARVEVAGGGVHDDSLVVSVVVPQVSGRVYDGGVAPNPPLSAANLQIYGPNGFLSAQTDNAGSYILSGVAAGTYNMFVSRQDFLDGSLSVTVNAAGAVSTFTALSSSVAGSTNAAGGVDVVMSRAAVLLVTPSLSVSYSTQPADLWGSLQVAASTSLAAANQQSFFAPLHVAAGTTTIDDGGQWDPALRQFVAHTLFRFTVAPGAYTVQALLPAFTPSTATVLVASGINGLSLPPLSRKSTISGLVTVPANPNGLFVSVNAVNVSTAAGAGGGGTGVQLAPGVLSASYTVANLDAGLYLLRANANGLAAISTGPIAVLVSSDLVNVNFPALTAGAAISGNIVINADTTGSSLQAFVSAWSPGSLNFGSTNVFVNGGAAPLTIPYVINGLSAGATYQVYVNLNGASNGNLEVLGPQPLVAPAPATANFAISASSGVIAGTILLPAGNTDFLNVSLNGVTVASVRPQDIGKQFSIQSSTQLPGFACVPGGGGFANGYCGAGSSTATFSVQNVNTETDQITLYYATTGQTKQLTLPAVNGSTTTVFVDLSAQTFSISGSINDQATNALFNTNPNVVANAPRLAPQGYPAGLSSTTARVEAVQQQLSQYNVAISTVFNPVSSRVGLLTAAGTFTISNLPSGVYFVRTADLRACATCSIVVPSVGQIVNVAGASVSSVTLTISDGFTVSGSLSLDGGLQDARVFNLTVLNQRQAVVASTTVYLGDPNLGVTANSVGYSFSNLPANNFYTLTVADAGSPAAYVGAPVVFPNPGLSPNGLQASLSSQNLLMERAAYISGRMQDANTGELITAGNAALLAPNFQITATADPWALGGFAQAASSVAARPIQTDGTFIVGPLLPSLSYDLRLAQQSWDPSFLAGGSQNYAPVVVSALRPQPGQILSVGVITLSQGQSLSGTVRQSTTTGVTLGNILVIAQPTFGNSGLTVRTYTNQNGQYTLWVSTAISNEYDVTAAPRGGNQASNGTVYGPATLHAVNLLATTTADFLLNPLVVGVTGQIVVPDAGTGGVLGYPFGALKGFPAAAVFMQPQGVVPTQNPLGDISAITDSLGNFSIPGLSTGTFSLKAMSLGYAVFNATITASTSTYVMYTGSNTATHFLPGNVITLSRGASVTGRIVKSDGTAPNNTEVAGVAAANFATGDYLVGSVDIDPNSKTVNDYTISGFKTGVAYNIVILPADKRDDTIFPPEGSGVTFLPQESTTTKNISLTFTTSNMGCVAAAKGLGSGQFQIKIDCNKGLRNQTSADSDLTQILQVSTYTSAGQALIAPSGTGQLLNSDKQISSDRKEITAIYRTALNETSFSLRLRAAAAEVNPQNGSNFSVDGVFDFYTGLTSNVNNRIGNINGGSISMQPSGQDELLGVDERSGINLQPGTFALGLDSQPDSSVVASATTTITVGMAKATDQQSASVLAMRSLGYVPSSLGVLANPSAYPAEVAAAMGKIGVLAGSTNTVGGANPLSSFYAIFLPAGIRHQLKQLADVTLSYSTTLSSATPNDNVNIYYYNPTIGQYVLENNNRRLDTVNHTITVSVNHFSVFVVLDGQPIQNFATPIRPADIEAANFPNPVDCTQVHAGLTYNLFLSGGVGGTIPPFQGTMIRYTLPTLGEIHEAKLRIYDLAGELVRSMDQGGLAGGFTYYTPWNCTNGSGRRVASGVYIGEIEWNGHRKFVKIAIINGSKL